MSVMLDNLMKKYSLFVCIDDYTNEVSMTSSYDKDFTKEDLNTIVFYAQMVELRMEYFDDDDNNTVVKELVRGENGITFQQFLKGVEAVRSKAVNGGDLTHNFLEDVEQVVDEGVPTYELEFGS